MKLHNYPLIGGKIIFSGKEFFHHNECEVTGNFFSVQGLVPAGDVNFSVLNHVSDNGRKIASYQLLNSKTKSKGYPHYILRGNDVDVVFTCIGFVCRFDMDEPVDIG